MVFDLSVAPSGLLRALWPVVFIRPNRAVHTRAAFAAAALVARGSHRVGVAPARRARQA